MNFIAISGPRQQINPIVGDADSRKLALEFAARPVNPAIAFARLAGQLATAATAHPAQFTQPIELASRRSAGGTVDACLVNATEASRHGRGGTLGTDADRGRITRGNSPTSKCLPERAGQIRRAAAAAAGAARAAARLARHRAALFASGRGARSGAGGAGSGRRHRHGERQDAVLQLADSRSGARRPERPRALSVSHQGARAGSAQGTAGTGRRRPANWRPRFGPASTTATRPRPSAAAFAAKRIWCSRIPTCCTRRCCRIIRSGRRSSPSCGTWWSTKCTRIAAFSVRMCRPCCGGCSASASTMARGRCFWRRARRLPIPASWRAGSSAAR